MSYSVSMESKLNVQYKLIDFVLFPLKETVQHFLLMSNKPTVI